MTKRNGTEDAEADKNSKASSGLTMDYAERKRNQREKKKKKKKDMNEKFETHDTDQVRSDKSTDWQEGESVCGKGGGEEVMEEEKRKMKKKQKVKRNNRNVGEKDGEVIQGHNETKEKKKRKDDSFVRSKYTHHNHSKCDEVGLSSKWHENVLHDVEDHTQSPKDDGTNHERKKKKKKHTKKEKYKDGLPAAQQEYVDGKIMKQSLPRKVRKRRPNIWKMVPIMNEIMKLNIQRKGKRERPVWL